MKKHSHFFIFFALFDIDLPSKNSHHSQNLFLPFESIYWLKIVCNALQRLISQLIFVFKF